MTIFNKYFILLYSPDLNDLVVFPIQFKTEKLGLKLNIQKTKILSSGLFTSWQIDGKTGNGDRFYFRGLQNHCRWSWQL